MLCYMVPGSDGELEKGKRQYNWVWYVNKTTSELAQILIDKDGFLRKYAVPPSFLSSLSISSLHQLADKHLPANLKHRIYQTANPFVQVVVDMNVPIMYHKRTAILGDEASVVRPHTAAGTAKAYRDAIALADCLFHHKSDVFRTLQHWNDQQLRDAKNLTEHGLNLAARSGFGN